MKESIEKVKKAEDAYNEALLRLTEGHPDITVRIKVIDHFFKTNSSTKMEVETSIAQKLL